MIIPVTFVSVCNISSYCMNTEDLYYHVPVKFVSVCNISSYCIKTEDLYYNVLVKGESENDVEKVYAT